VADVNSISIPSGALTTAAANAPWRARLRPFMRMVDWKLFGLRGLTLTRLAWTFVFSAGFSLWSTTANLLNFLGDTGIEFSWAWHAETFRNWFGHYSFMFLPQMLALTLADNLPLRGPMRFAALALAAALGTCAFPLLACTLLPDRYSDCRDFPSWSTTVEFHTYMVAGYSTACVIAAAYLTRRRDRELAAVLHASQLARIDAQRRTLEAHLQVLQARVEPTFLFDVLRDVATLHESDTRAGDRMLDQLIQYLRAALPEMRVSGSTVAKEAELLRAYLNILALRSPEGLTLSIHVAKGLHDARVPPMMLVPLVTPAGATQTAAIGEASTMRVDIRNVDDRLRIALTATGDIARTVTDSPAVDEVRGRLDALYGARAALAVDRTAVNRVKWILEIPHERADRAAR